MRQKPKSIKDGPAGNYLSLVIAVALFVAGLPMFFDYKPNSYLFVIGGVLLLAAIFILIHGAKTLAT
jgi:hypothetical protein